MPVITTNPGQNAAGLVFVVLYATCRAGFYLIKLGACDSARYHVQSLITAARSQTFESN